MTPSRLVLAVVVVFSLVSPWAPPVRGAESPSANVAPIAPLEGKLPNGLRYIVLPQVSGKRDISLRLVVQAGSLDERDDERGFAHFVEHMAFNGTRNHPAGSVAAFFQKLGLTFGADLNANTSYTHTNYLIDLPEGRGDHLDESLGMLRDYADGILFLPEKVTQESKVVISELNARDSEGRRVGVQLVENLYAGTRLPTRDVGGVSEQLVSATPEQLRAFYRRHYAPSRMVVVVVGAIEASAVVEKISSAFASMVTPAESVPPAEPMQVPAITENTAHVLPVPTIPSAQIEIVHLAPRKPDTREGRREELLQHFALTLLTRRLQSTRERGDISRYAPPRAAFAAAPVNSLVHQTITIGTAASDWTAGLQFIESELRRARSGFTAVEIAEGVAGELATFRNRIAATQPSARIANEIATLTAIDHRWTSAVDDLAEATEAFAGLTPDEVTKSLQSVFPEDGCHLVLLISSRNQTTPEKLLAAFTKSTGRTLRKGPAEEAELTFRYTDFGPPGEIAKRDRLEDLDLTLVTFGNGVRLNVRPSKFENDRFRLRIVFPQNASFIQDEQGGIAELAGQILISSNLNKHKETEISRLIKLHGIVPEFSVSHGTPVLSLSGPAAELSFALQFLTALLSDLQFDDDHYRVALSRYGGVHHSLVTNSRPFALAEALYFYTGKDQRVIMRPPQTLAYLPPSEDESWLRTNLMQGPLEIGIVGDLSADEIVASAANTVGTLKRRKAASKPTIPLRSPTKPSRVESTAELPASTSMSCILWPVKVSEDPRRNAALSLATDILRDRLMLVLREALGATYSPSAYLHRDAVQRDFSYAAVVNSFDPTNAIRLTEGTIKLAARTAERGVSEEEFARLLEPMRTRYTNDLRSNPWWLNAVSTAQSLPEGLASVRAHGKICEELTLADVNEAAQVFKLDLVTVVILRPKTVPPGKAGPTKK